MGEDELPYRFLNLLDATIVVNESRTIKTAYWNPASKIYQNPSFAKIASEAFDTRRSIVTQDDRVIFRQTTGARTVSPEVIGGFVGELSGGIVTGPFFRKIGRGIAHRLVGFPPIWTTLQMTLYADCRWEGSVVGYSLFPSMNYYQPNVSTTVSVKRESSSYSLVGFSYDAVSNLDNWKVNGWGPLYPSISGPSKGNPWGLRREDLTLGPSTSATRIA